MKSHKDLILWKKSVSLVTAIYTLTKLFPKEELYGIASQIRRAAISIPANISEGAARNHNKEFIQFLYIALGSLSELETHFIICENLNYVSLADSKKFQDEFSELRKMTLGLIGHLKYK